MKRLLAALLALMMLLTMTSCAAPDAAETDDKLTLVAFNVGKADALLLTSGDTAYLIDTGTEDSWADLSRALEALGVTHLTGVIVTHMDKDHYGGAKQLAESDIAIDGWYASWAWEKEKWKKHPVVKAAAIRGEEITLLQPGDTLSDGLLTVIGPIQEREESENDNSLVLARGANGDWTPHDMRRTAATMMQALNDDLERQVRVHMDQWFWIHRRWKDLGGRPESEDDIPLAGGPSEPSAETVSLAPREGL